MITYVNTVFVSNNSEKNVASTIPAGNASNAASNKGRFIFYDVDANAYSITSSTKRFKIGMFTGKLIKDIKGQNHLDIKWSNIIQTADIKSVSLLNYTASTEDAVYIDFSGIADEVVEELAKGGKRIIVRLTFKDLPTRYRKWTESYEYVTEETNVESDKNAFKAKVAADIAALINKQWKRARVSVIVGSLNTTSASNNGSVNIGNTNKYFHTDSNWNSANSTTGQVIKIEAMPYDDDDTVDTLNCAEKVRFNANCYWTDPAAEGWASLNKMFMKGMKIAKTPGFRYAADAKLVRDREAQAMGYDGILNRGNGTWPIVKPAMETQLSGEYSALVIEFENMYRAADDIFRKTKQAVEIYAKDGSTIVTPGVDGAADITTKGITLNIYDAINIACGKNARVVSDVNTEDGVADA